MNVRRELAVVHTYDRIVISEGGLIPLTDEKIDAFTLWARETYGNYSVYRALLREPILDSYIQDHIFTQDMKTIWRVSEPYMGVTTDRLRIQELILKRKKLVQKIKYMKIKLGKLAFPDEAREVREEERLRRGPTVRDIRNKIFVEVLTEEQANEEMEDECSICMSNHKMIEVCIITCGHQFGSTCLDNWKYNTCPLCREPVNQVIKYKM